MTRARVMARVAWRIALASVVGVGALICVVGVTVECIGTSGAAIYGQIVALLLITGSALLFRLAFRRHKYLLSLEAACLLGLGLGVLFVASYVLSLPPHGR